jgi:hypothetical protein
VVKQIYSSNLQERRRFIKSYLQKLDIPIWEQPFLLKGYGGENIIIKRWMKNDMPNIIISAHYDGWGAYDNVGGTAALLWLINFINLDNKSLLNEKFGLIFVFLDGEESGLLGVRFFASHFLSQKKVTYYGQISLDGFGIGTSIGGFANTRKIQLRNDANEIIPFILEADTLIFQENDIPSLHLFSLPFDEMQSLLNKRQFPNTWRIIHTKEDTPDKLNEEFLPFVVMNLYRNIYSLDFKTQGVIIIGE